MAVQNHNIDPRLLVLVRASEEGARDAAEAGGADVGADQGADSAAGGAA
jgi:hypothetical protein